MSAAADATPASVVVRAGALLHLSEDAVNAVVSKLSAEAILTVGDLSLLSASDWTGLEVPTELSGKIRELISDAQPIQPPLAQPAQPFPVYTCLNRFALPGVILSVAPLPARVDQLLVLLQQSDGACKLLFVCCVTGNVLLEYPITLQHAADLAVVGDSILCLACWPTAYEIHVIDRQSLAARSICVHLTAAHSLAVCPTTGLAAALDRAKGTADLCSLDGTRPRPLIGPSLLSGPSGLCFDLRGQLCVTEPHRISIFDPAGSCVRTASQFQDNSLRAIAVNREGQFLVCDSLGRQILVLDSSLNLLGTFGASELRCPCVVRVRDDGAVYVVSENRVFHYCQKTS
jgi:hypothetical protein